jgi:hypothetical protein
MRLTKPGVGVAAVAGLALVSTSTGTTPTVGAFPKLNGNSCPTGDLLYRFSDSDQDWADPEIVAVEAGFARWTTYRNRGADVIATIVESTSQAAVPVIRLMDGPNVVNSVSCNGQLVSINLKQPVATLARSAAHEAGHGLGLSHTGNRDSHPFSGTNANPLMNGCNVSAGVPYNDDLAQLSSRYDGGAQTSDMGFENSIGAYQGAFSRTIGNAFDGDWKVDMTQGNAITTRPVRLTTAGGTVQRMAVRHWNAAAGNKLKFLYRPVNYGAGVCGSGLPGNFNPDNFNWGVVSYPNGENTWSLGSTITLGGSPVPPGWVTSNTIVPAPTPFPSATGWGTWNAVDVQVQFFAETSPARIDEMVSYS